MSKLMNDCFYWERNMVDGRTLKSGQLMTIGGRAFDLLDPRPMDVDPVDIGHALSRICRYGGHIPAFYSVAEHSVLVARRCLQVAGPLAGLCGLMHDATEAYLGDVIWPLKHEPVMTLYRALEKRMAAAIDDRFGLPPVERVPIVGEADRAVLLAEVRDLLGSPQWAVDRVGQDGIEPWPPEPIHCWGVERARYEFCTLYERLEAQRYQARKEAIR